MSRRTRARVRCRNEGEPGADAHQGTRADGELGLRGQQRQGVAEAQHGKGYAPARAGPKRSLALPPAPGQRVCEHHRRREQADGREPHAIGVTDFGGDPADVAEVPAARDAERAARDYAARRSLSTAHEPLRLARPHSR